MSKQMTVSDILKIFLQHIKLIIILTLVGTVLAYLYVSFMVTPVYSTSALILVQSSSSFEAANNNSNANLNDDINVNNISSSVMLANTCATLFTVDPDMKSIVSGASVSITPIEESYFLRITSSSTDPNTAATIANRVANTAPEVFRKQFGDAGKVGVVEEASIPSSPSSPSKSRYIMMGLLAGLVLSMAISFLLGIIDTTIKPGDDLYKQYDIPVFAEIIDFDAEGGKKK